MFTKSVLPAIHRCNSFTHSPTSSKSSCLPLYCEGHRVGSIRLKTPLCSWSHKNVITLYCFFFIFHCRPNVFEALEAEPSIFVINQDSSIQFKSRSAAERTSQVAMVLEKWRKQGTFEALSGWRNEVYPVVTEFGQTPLLTIERAAVGIFGFQAFGVHVNGHVEAAGGKPLRLWIARRSPQKQMWPGYLDNFVGGGIPVGVGVRENLVKECGEEAGVTPELAARAVPVGAVSYVHDLPRGVYPETLFVYDLEVPADFVPVPADGEVSEFTLWEPQEILARILREEFQPESALVTIDFLIRRGVITPETEINYLAVVAGMHAKVTEE